MNKCKYCGADIATPTKFCPNCGKEQVTEEPSIIAVAPISTPEMPVQPEIGPIEPTPNQQVSQPESSPAFQQMPEIAPQQSPIINQSNVAQSASIPVAPSQPSTPQQPSLPSQVSQTDNQQNINSKSSKNKVVDELKTKLTEKFLGKMPLWSIFLIIIIVAGLIGLLIGINIGSNRSSNNTVIGDTTTTKTTGKNYQLGDNFKFSGFKITTGKDIKIEQITNEYSSYYGKEVVKVPVIIQNLNAETKSLSSVNYSYLGSKGREVKNVSSSSNEDSIDYAGELRANATTEQLYFYMLYDGDGTYTIEFDDFREKAVIEFQVKK